MRRCVYMCTLQLFPLANDHPHSPLAPPALSDLLGQAKIGRVVLTGASHNNVEFLCLQYGTTEGKFVPESPLECTNYNCSGACFPIGSHGKSGSSKRARGVPAGSPAGLPAGGGHSQWQRKGEEGKWNV